MVKLLIGSVVSTIALFLFGFIYWGANPLPYGAIKSVNDDVATGAALLEHFPESGLYYVPNMKLEEEKSTELHEKGPIAMLRIQREGENPMNFSRMALGLLHHFVSAFFIGLLMLKVASSLKTIKERISFATLAGVAATIFINPAQVIWWRSPWGWEIHTMMYVVLSWLIVGAVMAKFLPAEAES